MKLEFESPWPTCPYVTSVTPLFIRAQILFMGRERTGPDIQDSVLTTGQRKFLQSGIQSGDSARTKRRRIRERVREGMRDFRLLADHLEERDREQIFDVEPHSEAQRELEKDVTKAIEFFYAGMGGEADFRSPLKLGVRSGEVKLGHIEYGLDVEPQFSVHARTRSDEYEALEAIKAGEWEHLSARDLFAFIREAVSKDAIDFDAMEEGHPAPRSSRRRRLREQALDRDRDSDT